jgi:hypothetical protein
MVDRWLVFVALEFVSAAIGFAWWFVSHGKLLFLMAGFFFFALGAFAFTRWGFDKWKGKQKTRKRVKK